MNGRLDCCTVDIAVDIVLLLGIMVDIEIEIANDG